MNRPKTIGAGVLIGFLLAGSAWAQFGRVGDIMKKAQEKAEAFQPMTNEQEVAMGREVAAKLIAYFKVFENPKAEAYVRKVGQGVALQSERQDVTYHFDILDTDVVNAFSTPGGFIFVTRGLLENISTEGELAGVLAHEVGHVTGKHVVNAIQRGKALQTGLKEAGNFSPGSRFLEDMAKDILVRLIDRGLDPKDENDADQRGVNYAYAAGYRPDGLKNFLVTLDQLNAQSSEKTSWLARTHPPAGERIQRLDRYVADRKMDVDGRPDLRDRYQVTMSDAAKSEVAQK